MRLRVMSDFVSGGVNRGDEIGIPRGAFPDHEKRSLGAMVGEESEDLRRVVGIGSVVDREPDFAPGGFETGKNLPQTLGRGNDDLPNDEGIHSEIYDDRRGVVPRPEQEGEKFAAQKQQHERARDVHGTIKRKASPRAW